MGILSSPHLPALHKERIVKIVRAKAGCSHSFAMCPFCCDEKKLENICDFVWWYQKISVPLHHRLRPVEQTHRGPATGHSYDGSEG